MNTKNGKKISEVADELEAKPFAAHKWAAWIMAIGLGAYFIQFSLWPFGTCLIQAGATECDWVWFSNSTGVWGEFGDFVGGTINPFIGFLTVYLLVKTVYQQNAAIKQTETALEQANNSLDHAKQALQQNEESLKIAREEIRLSREITASTEAALKKQIDISMSQNNFSNYYKHLEEFQKYCNNFGGVNGVNTNLLDLRKLHLSLFPHSMIGVLSIKQDRAQPYINLMEKLLDLISSSENRTLLVSDITKHVSEWNAVISHDLSQRDVFLFGNSMVAGHLNLTGRDYLFGVSWHLIYIFRVLNFDAIFDKDAYLTKAADLINKLVWNISDTGSTIIFPVSISNGMDFNTACQTCRNLIQDYRAIQSPQNHRPRKKQITAS